MIILKDVNDNLQVLFERLQIEAQDIAAQLSEIDNMLGVIALESSISDTSSQCYQMVDKVKQQAAGLALYFSYLEKSCSMNNSIFSPDDAARHLPLESQRLRFLGGNIATIDRGMGVDLWGDDQSEGSHPQN